MKRLFSILSILFVFIVAHAQVQVEQTIDSVQIFIGQQVNMTLSVTTPQGAKVVFPQFKKAQYLVPGVEIVETKLDTAKVDDLQKVSQIYTLTSFDERLYPLPALKVKVNGKSYDGTTLALKVLTMDVDTLHPNQFFPPKDVQNNPFLASEWVPPFLLSVLLLIVCGLTVYLFVRLKQNKPIIAKVKIIRHIPAHQKALDSIEKIKVEKLITSENQKVYYTALTDVLRQYIQERFGFNAMEMTSSEIIYHLQQAGDQKMIYELKELFQTADLVKFAKYSTLVNEKDLNLVNAINFIDQTKQEQNTVEERVIPQLSSDEQKQQKNRFTIKALLIVSTLVIVCIIVSIFWYLYQIIG
ncbi:hypothetical protein [Prevotella sp.]|uniref:hypothetical protein n=1 Tax=Prevotella sp. TaxID=59823 RepID=UPI002F951C1B